MTITPEDIQAKQFNVRFRGFDIEEVDAFLEQIAENFLMMLEENKTMKIKLDLLSKEFDSLKSEENSFKKAMISAQEVAAEMRVKSRDQADALLVQAKEEVASLKEQAHGEVTELEQRIDQLKAVKSELLSDLRAVIHSYLDKLESPESSSPLRSSDTTVDDSYSSVHSDIKAAPEEPDLSDLYEKIELPPMENHFEEDKPMFNDSRDEIFEDKLILPEIDIPGLDEQEGALTIPDLDDEIMFTLEDPLDQEDLSLPEIEDVAEVK